MFKPEDNNYSRFIDALQVCDEKYLDSDECKKHYNKNWWLKYNCLAVKESIKNIHIFNRIPNEILKNNKVIPFINTKNIFNEYYKHIEYKNICALWLHRDTTEEIKKMCIMTEEKHINKIKQWVSGRLVFDLNKNCDYEKIIQNNVTTLSEYLFRNFRLMQFLYEKVVKVKKKYGYMMLSNCIDIILKNDDLDTFKRYKFLMNRISNYLYFAVKHKSVNIVKYIISYDYGIVEDHGFTLGIYIYNGLDDSSIKFMLQYLLINPYMERQHPLISKYGDNFKANESKKINKLCKSLQTYYLKILNTYYRDKHIDSQ